MTYSPKRPGQTYQVDGHGKEIEQKSEKKTSGSQEKGSADAKTDKKPS